MSTNLEKDDFVRKRRPAADGSDASQFPSREIVSPSQQGTSSALNEQAIGFSRERTFRRRPTEKILRRFEGMILEDHGEQVTVLLREEGNEWKYLLPARILHENSIKNKHQPFQIDELERRDPQSGSVEIAYQYRPISDPSEASVETIDLTQGVKDVRDYILQQLDRETQD